MPEGREPALHMPSVADDGRRSWAAVSQNRGHDRRPRERCHCGVAGRHRRPCAGRDRHGPGGGPARRVGARGVPAVPASEPEDVPAVPEPEAVPRARAEDVPAMPTPEPDRRRPPCRVVVAAEIASHAAPRRRRRWPWITLVVVVLALAAAVGAGLWYISGLIGAGAAVPQPDDGFPLTIVSAEGAQRFLLRSQPPGTTSASPGVTTIEGGYLQTDDPVAAGSGVASRVILDCGAAARPGRGRGDRAGQRLLPAQPAGRTGPRLRGRALRQPARAPRPRGSSPARRAPG